MCVASRDAGTGGYIICDIKLLILSQIQIESESEATIEPRGESRWRLELEPDWVWVGSRRDDADAEHP